jgi:hypothetical protein
MMCERAAVIDKPRCGACNTALLEVVSVHDRITTNPFKVGAVFSEADMLHDKD